MDEEIWKGLLKTALAILDDLDAHGDGAPEVAMGGGTVLMMRMRHRLRACEFFTCVSFA